MARGISVDIDYNGYDTMVDFIGTLDDDKLYKKLSNAIQGKGAFRRFRSIVEGAGVLQNWYRFKDAAQEKAVLDWCEAHDFSCNKSGEPVLPSTHFDS